MIQLALPLMVFPAPAGMILTPLREDPMMFGIPRTSGDDPDSTGGYPIQRAYSPHQRG
ncbi:hypothetical protein FC07_GL000318 [Loigolactobacillus bifermentans DSM 20003]|uniref:Uncharacterized protein n=1 Tax=Loigolactobacillus bifermentans DSM 20003 TaxID=1423726 RepID=A0A0R1GW96_9LACO|nr:hypothetical protein FC07_GL000318 [Loigolactobacillus bifermentans DSM 20003]